MLKNVFGQIGGTQRLTHAVGKAKAMDLVLTGRPWTAQEAEAAGLVARIYPADTLVEESIKAAQEIASYSLPSVLMAKEAINKCKLRCTLNDQQALNHSI